MLAGKTQQLNTHIYTMDVILYIYHFIISEILIVKYCTDNFSDHLPLCCFDIEMTRIPRVKLVNLNQNLSDV